MSHLNTQTRCILVAYPRGRDEAVDLSRALVAFDTTKQMKQVGRAHFELKPLANWANVLRPNDMLVFYVDTGEGRGFEWSFFGYIDTIRMASSIVQERSGAPVTSYVLECSDFQKVIEQTRLYFNPFLSGRRELVMDVEFAKDNSQGGLGLGVGALIYGSPADIVETILVAGIGFGRQWVLPDSFPDANLSLGEQRAVLRTRAARRLPGRVRRDVSWLSDDLAASPMSDVETRIAAEIAKTNAAVDAGVARGAGVDDLDRLRNISRSLSILNVILQRTSTVVPNNIMDVLSFDFIETETIDGWQQTTAPTDGSVRLSEMINAWSNEIVNELFFDLRPVSTAEDIFAAQEALASQPLTPAAPTGPAHHAGVSAVTLALEAQEERFAPSASASARPAAPPTPIQIPEGNARLGSAYSYDADINGINDGGYGSQRAEAPAVRYVPAIVMREYPFSTVEGVDFRGLRMLAGGASAVDSKNARDVGYVPFGPIFNTPVFDRGTTRVYYNYKLGATGKSFTQLSPMANPSTLPPIKHLDVATLSMSEVESYEVSRGDAGSVGLLNIFTTHLANVYGRTYLHELMPITTPASILRDGLRVVELPTKFMAFVENVAAGTDATTVPAARHMMARWGLLWDHWFQHAYEYLTSSFLTSRMRGDIRIGYRLDVPERHESSYVEMVHHQGRLNGGAWNTSTRISTSRGQRNDPHPAYIPPQFSTTVSSNAIAAAGGGDRSDDGRLARYSPLVDTGAEVIASPPSEQNEIDAPPSAGGPSYDRAITYAVSSSGGTSLTVTDNGASVLR